MYDTTVNRDYGKTELNYRFGRIQSDIAGRRRRRSMFRRAEVGDDTFGTAR